MLWWIPRSLVVDLPGVVLSRTPSYSMSWTPGGGTLSAAVFGVRRIEVVAFLNDTTSLAHDLRGIFLNRVHRPFNLEVLLPWGEGFVLLACRSRPSALCCAGLRPAGFGIG